jgi:hypothetical protein
MQHIRAPFRTAGPMQFVPASPLTPFRHISSQTPVANAETVLGIKANTPIST